MSFRKTSISENNDMKQDTILQKIGLNQKKDAKYDTVFVSKDSVVVNIHDKTVSVCLTKDTLKVIDWKNEAMSYGAKEPDTTIFSETWNPFGSILFPKYFHNWSVYAPFYVNISKIDSFNVNFIKMYDTIIERTPYKALFTIVHTFSTRADSYSEWIPVYDSITYFCNKETDLIERITVKSGRGSNIRYSYHFTHFSLKKQNLKTSEIFDFSNPRYRNFEKYNFNLEYVHPSLDNIGWSREGNFQDSALSSKILDFPLKDTENKTHFLKDYTGWILIDIWTYGCRPCYAFHNKLKQEQDSLGYRILENEGMKIFCINTYSDVKKLKKYANMFNVSDITFCADEKLYRHFDIRVHPKYYLYSPDGKLVFEGYVSPDDYSPLLKAKADYEKRHNSKP